MLKRLIVTADDLGLTEEINLGIFAAHREGIVTSASLLMNGLATESALAMARAYPSLEVGIHLSIVEGLSLCGHRSSVTDTKSYFPDKLCLIRDWKTFLLKFLLGKVRLKNVENELRAQLHAFRKTLGDIPFANSTQHLHLLPGIQKIVLRLLSEFKVPYLRLPGGYRFERNARWPSGWMIHTLGLRMRKRAQTQSTDGLLGFRDSGCLKESQLMNLLTLLKPGLTELMTHPGLDSPILRKCLPNSYARFMWETELSALTSARVKQFITTHEIVLTRFGDGENFPTMT